MQNNKKYWSGFTWREVEMKPYHLLGHGLSLLLANLLIFEDYAIQRLREWEKWIKDKTCERGWKLFFFYWIVFCILSHLSQFSMENSFLIQYFAQLNDLLLKYAYSVVCILRPGKLNC